MKRYRRGKNRCKICGWKLDDGQGHWHLVARVLKRFKNPKVVVRTTPTAKVLPLFEETKDVQ